LKHLCIDFLLPEILSKFCTLTSEVLLLLFSLLLRLFDLSCPLDLARCRLLSLALLSRLSLNSPRQSAQECAITP
jgi:hypothetical protein